MVLIKTVWQKSFVQNVHIQIAADDTDVLFANLCII